METNRCNEGSKNRKNIFNIMTHLGKYYRTCSKRATTYIITGVVFIGGIIPETNNTYLIFNKGHYWQIHVLV